MRYRMFLGSMAILAGWLATAPVSAQTIYFADDFEEATDSTLFLEAGSIGGDTTGDADPNSPQEGFWDFIGEDQPYRIQVTQGMNGVGPANPGPGPASGVNALGLHRLFPGNVDIRGDFEEVARGLISVDFDLWVNFGQAQFYPRNGTLGGFDGYPILVNFNATGQAQVNNGTFTAPFYTVDTGTGPADIEYNHVQFLIDLDAQNFSLSVDGNTLPELTNRAFATDGAAGTEPVSQLQQVIFGEPTGDGVYYIDNLLVQSAAAPPAVDADFDDDSDVDGNDFLIWQRGVGGAAGTDNADGNADGDSDVDGTDLAIWETEFGTPQSLANATPVPEPTGAALVGLGAMALAAVRRRR